MHMCPANSIAAAWLRPTLSIRQLHPTGVKVTKLHQAFDLRPEARVAILHALAYLKRIWRLREQPKSGDGGP
jgi:hypothetical protein